MRWTNLHLYACLSLGLTGEAHRFSLLSRQFAPYVTAISSLLGGNGLIPATSGAIQGLLGRDQEFDFVVVGGGTGGNAIGYRLAEAGFSVAIVEAGTFFEFSKPGFSTIPGLDVLFVGSDSAEALSPADWKFQTTPQQGANNRKLQIAQGKCVGGSSAWNFMIHHRGPKGMYDQWAEAVGDDSYK